MKKRIYFTYKLNLKIIVYSFFLPNCIFYYLHSGKTLNKFINKKKFIKILIKSDQIKDKNGMETWTKVNYLELYELEKLFLQKNSYLHGCKSEEINFIIKSSLYGLHYYDDNGIWRNVYLLNAFNIYFNNNKHDSNFYYVCDDFQNFDIFSDYSKKFNIKIIRLFSLNYFIKKKKYLITLTKLFLISFFVFKKERKNSDQKPIISLLYNGNKNFSDFSYYNDLLFTKDLKYQNFKTQFIFHNKSFSFSKSIKSLFNNQNNIYFVENNYVSKLNDIKFVMNFDFKIFLFFFKFFAFSKKQFDRNYFYLSKLYYKNLFVNSDTKIFFDWNRHYFMSPAIFSALNSINSIYVLYTRSFFNAHTPLIRTNADLCLSFGDHIELEKKSNSYYKYYIIVGSYYYFKDNTLLDRSKTLRNNFFNKDVKNVISYFDENTIDKSEFFDGHHVIQDQISQLIYFLNTDISLGLILKPKNINTFYNRIGNVKKDLDILIKSKRIFVFDDRNMTSLVAEAACASDFVIHSSIHACTAAIESALNGVRTIFINSNNYIPISNLELKKNVNYVNSLDEFIAQWYLYIQNKKLSKFGLWNNLLLDQIDPFRDGKAYIRIGQLLNDISSNLSKTNSKDTAIEYAVNKYKLNWGNDKVIKYS